MIRRLVEQQQIGRLPNNQRQYQPGFLASGKRCDRLKDSLSAEAEAAQVVSMILLAVAGRVVPQMIDGTVFRSQ